MIFFLFILKHYSAIGLLALCAYVFGARLLKGFAFDSRLERTSFATALGLGAISFLVFLLGLFHLLYPAVMIGMLLAGLIACRKVWCHWPRALQSLFQNLITGNRSRLLITLGSCIVMAFLLRKLFILPLYPPTQFDATMYHLPYAKSYVQQHALVFLPFLRVPVFPQTVEMLFTLALLLFDELTAQLIELLMLLIVGAALMAWSQRWFSWRVGIWAIAFLFASRLVIWLCGVAYIDLGLMAFATMMFYAFEIWRRTGGQCWLVLAGIFSGLAAGTKYTALFFTLALTVAAAMICWRRAKLLDALAFAGVACLTASPWYLRNLYYTSNPVFPFLYSIFGNFFGYGMWKSEYVRNMDIALRTGATRSAWDVMRFPLDLAFNQMRLAAGSAPPISGLYFQLLPLTILTCLKTRQMRLLLGITICFVFFCFLFAPQSRYLVPVLPLLSIMTAINLDTIFKNLAPRYQHNYLINVTLTIFLLFLCLQPARKELNYRIFWQGNLPVTSEQREEYLNRNLPTYSFYSDLNKQNGQSYRVYALFQENMPYYCDGVFMGDWFGPASFSRILNNKKNGESLFRELIALDADYFLVDGERADLTLPDDEVFRQRLHLISQKGKIKLYQIVK